MSLPLYVLKSHESFTYVSPNVFLVSRKSLIINILQDIVRVSFSAPNASQKCGAFLFVSSRDHQVEFFKDQQYPNGDVSTVIRMKVALNDDDISKLISKGARHLPIEEKSKKGWLERISGLDGANNGVYFFEQGEQELECKFLIYDRDSHVLYYYLSIM